MKTLKEIRHSAIVESHRRKLIIGSLIIQYMAAVVTMMSLIGIFIDQRHLEAYCEIFIFFAIIGVFGVIQHSNHKRG